MIQRGKNFISFFLLFVLFASVLCSQQAYGDDPNLDFWWDYGEADEKHATFAPAMEKEITRKTRVEVVALEKHKIFVADEYLQIRYLIRVPFDVRIDEKKLPQELTPFEIVAFHFGQRRAIKNDRDMELQELLLTLRLAPSFPYDTYILPSFDLHYQFDTIVGNSRLPQEESVTLEEISLEKVPVYVRVQQQRNTGFLWDAIPCLLEIHADNSVNFLNLNLNSEDDVLLQFKPDYPFVLQNKKRSMAPSEHYRVIRYEFVVAVQDFRGQPFTLTFPQVTWKQKGATPESENVITSESPAFFVQQITTESTRVSPLKKNIPELSDERYILLDLPLQILWSLIILGIFWFSFLSWQYHKQKMAVKVDRISKPVQPAYDKWPWQKVILGFLIIRARHQFQKNPNQKNCEYLRDLLARRIAMQLSSGHKMSVAQVYALTANELAQLGGRKQELSVLIQLEGQLESDHYCKLQDNSEEAEK